MNDGIGRAGYDRTENVGVDPHLRPEHRQNQENADHNHYPIRLQPGERCGECVGQHADSNSTAIERREREHIEDCDDDVDVDRVRQIPQDPLAGTRRQIANSVEV